jgi:site-specific recombinase XerD
MAQVSCWLADQDLGADALSTETVERYLEARRAAGYTTLRTEQAMKPMLTYLRGLDVLPPPPPTMADDPVDALLERYRHYHTVERGLGGPTARGYVVSVRHFLLGRISHDGRAVDLVGLTAADVRAFVVARCPTQSPSPARLTVSALRSLLRFLHVAGTLQRSLAHAVPSAAGRRLVSLPKGVEPRDVRKLLSSCDRRRTTGRRDFAILTMLVRLGLRAGEVAVLGLDDIDWRAATLVIRGKGNRADTLPLPSDVGEAVAAYLRRGRPPTAEGRAVFVRVQAPYRRLTSCGVTQVVAAAARRAGLGQIHAHRLRHTAATQMLRAGATLPEVGQILRHRRALTTAIYAKVDRDALRTIARPWPGGEG